MLISVRQGTLSPVATTGLILNGLDGSNGLLELKGTFAAVNAALTSGVLYSNNGGGLPFSDTLSIAASDGYVQASESINFNASISGITVNAPTDSGWRPLIVSATFTSPINRPAAPARCSTIRARKAP